MRTQYAAWLDPEILAALPRIIPPFPPGMKVRLSDGCAAAVTATSSRTPYRPTVRRFAADGWTLEPRTIDLSREGDLHVSTAVGVPVRAFVPDEPAPLATAYR